MDGKLKIKPWAMDEKDANSCKFVIFMADRGKDKPNAFVWVYLDGYMTPPIRITTFRNVIEYFTQAASPMYFGSDRSQEVMDACIDILNGVSDEIIDEELDGFYEDAYRREEREQEAMEKTPEDKLSGPISFEKDALKYLARRGRQGDGTAYI